MEKTLGQIAQEAFDSVDGRLFSKSWEAAAAAVRAAVLEEAAKVCEELPLYDPTPTAEEMRPNGPKQYAAAIRSMK